MTQIIKTADAVSSRATAGILVTAASICTMVMAVYLTFFDGRFGL